MTSCGKILSVLATLGLLAGSTFGQEPASANLRSPPKLDAVFKSLQESTQGQEIEIRWTPILLGGAAIALMTLAVKQWNRRQAKPKVKSQHNHHKLLKEAASRAGVSRRQLKTIAPLAESQGLSSPLVAVICPSAIKTLAQGVKTAEQQAALKALAHDLMKHQPKSVQGLLAAK